jgi:hypothetical protein
MTGASSRPAAEPTRPRSTDDRAVSTAVTHVLAIGITTILISGLLIAASGLLTGEQSRAGRAELQEVGNRIAEQMYVASTNVDESGPGTQTITVDMTQPARVAGYSYSVSLEGGGECTGIDGPPGGDPDHCLVLDPAAGLDVQPVKVPVDIEGTLSQYDTIDLVTTSGGEFTVVVEG